MIKVLWNTISNLISYWYYMICYWYHRTAKSCNDYIIGEGMWNYGWNHAWLQMKYVITFSWKGVDLCILIAYFIVQNRYGTWNVRSALICKEKRLMGVWASQSTWIWSAWSAINGKDCADCLSGFCLVNFCNVWKPSTGIQCEMLLDGTQSKGTQLSSMHLFSITFDLQYQEWHKPAILPIINIANL